MFFNPRLRQWMNRWHWTVRLLKLSKAHEPHQKPGLVMIQIDGFSKSELEAALERDEMPFLKKLLKKEKYKLHSFYTGLPSATPSVQGELFYGVKQCVPSFFFFDKPSQKVFRMFDGESVREMESRLVKDGKGLLEGGSSYSNIFTGGAKEAHFCAGSLGWAHIWKDVNIGNFFLLVLTHFVTFLRMTVLCLWETILAFTDFIYGLLKKEDFIIEFKFISLRVSLCILLRELITLGAIVDVTRGLPVIHLNFIGYDEQAHRRAPGSRTAHWALKGIDRAISRIYSAAMHSSQRHYDVWVYSDHGQEVTIPYAGHYGRSVEDAVSWVFAYLFLDKNLPVTNNPVAPLSRHRGVQHHRARYLGKWIEKIWPLNHALNGVSNPGVIVTAMGPLGGVYVSKELTLPEKCRFAAALVSSAHIPLVLMPEENGKVRAFNDKGEFTLPEEGSKIIGSDHPFFDDVIKDLIALCHHPNAGTLTISGWRLDRKPFSFPFENGAHAGPGQQETNAFALLPFNTVLGSNQGYLKVMDLRQSALRLLEGSKTNRNNSSPSKSSHENGRVPIRLMTYNVRSCIGMDGVMSARRIARVIGRYEPDIVALQELDLGRKRTGAVDQPHLIAKELEMLYHFHPAISVEEERYGDAILSRYPMEVMRAAKLPMINNAFHLEPRGALWVSIKIGDARLQIINTHLGFYGPECRLQARALMSSDWVGHPNCADPVILCGDFNCFPNSPAWRTIQHRLYDVQHLLNNHRPLATWSGQYPVGRIDHIFVSEGITVSAIEVPRTQLDILASDHLPLIADLEVILNERSVCRRQQKTLESFSAQL